MAGHLLIGGALFLLHLYTIRHDSESLYIALIAKLREVTTGKPGADTIINLVSYLLYKKEV